MYTHTTPDTGCVQSFPGVVVEVVSSHDEVEGFLAEDEGPVISQWLVINSTEQLDQFLVS